MPAPRATRWPRNLKLRKLGDPPSQPEGDHGFRSFLNPETCSLASKMMGIGSMRFSIFFQYSRILFFPFYNQTIYREEEVEEF